MPRCAVVVALVLVTATAPGCAAVAAGFAADNHLGGCMDSAAPATVDLVIGGLGVLALAKSGKLDESAGYLAIPGVFVGSGVIGAIFADRCRERTGPRTVPTYAAPAYAPPPAPPAPALEPDQRDAMREEIGLEIPRGPSAQLRLSPEYQLPDPPQPEKIGCSVDPLVACPDHMSCALDDEHGGHCVAIP